MPTKIESVFANAAEMHPADILKARAQLRTIVADFGAPDALALLADAIATQPDSGLVEVRAVLDSRARAVQNLTAIFSCNVPR